MTGPIWNKKVRSSENSCTSSSTSTFSVPHECLSYQGGQQNDSEKNPIKIQAYKLTVWQRMWLLVLCITTGGLILMLFYWKKDLLRKFKVLSKTNLLDSEGYLFITDSYDKTEIHVNDFQYFHKKHFQLKSGPDRVPTFVYHKTRYYYDSVLSSYLPIRHMIDSESPKPCKPQTILKNSVIFNQNFESLRKLKTAMFGLNQIVIEVPSVVMVFITELFSPFYIFQAASMILWFSDHYVIYATSILIMTTVSIVLSIKQIRQNSRSLKRMIEKSGKPVTRLNYGENGLVWEVCNDFELVEGDVVSLGGRDNDILTCDMVLLEGAVILDESMLTGESIPVTKVELLEPGQILGENGNILNYKSATIKKQNTLYAGTSIIQTRGSQVLAVVVRTGFYTVKGQLLTSIMFPKPLELSHQKDAIRFLINFGKLAAIAVIYTVVINIIYGTTPVEIFLLCADMITIVVPPALPAALAIGVFYSQKRLKKDHRIFCTSPQRINCGGQLSLVAFDKTGTLTEDRFSLVRYLSFDENSTNDVKFAMAVCHTLTISQNTGEIIGDPLDIELFQKSGYNFLNDNDQLITSKETGEQVKIIKQNPFNSENRCMDVLIETETGEQRKIIKGAPEKLASLIEKSKIPKSFKEDVENSTKEGLRVLAVAEGDQHQVTKILGLLILVNELKKETLPTLEKLHYANFRYVGLND